MILKHSDDLSANDFDRLTRKLHKFFSFRQATRAKLLLIILQLAWSRGYCFPSYETLANLLGCSVSCIDKNMRALKAAGFIHCYRSFYRYSCEKYRKGYKAHNVIVPNLLMLGVYPCRRFKSAKGINALLHQVEIEPAQVAAIQAQLDAFNEHQDSYYKAQEEKLKSERERWRNESDTGLTGSENNTVNSKKDLYLELAHKIVDKLDIDISKIRNPLAFYRKTLSNYVEALKKTGQHIDTLKAEIEVMLSNWSAYSDILAYAGNLAERFKQYVKNKVKLQPWRDCCPNDLLPIKMYFVRWVDYYEQKFGLMTKVQFDELVIYFREQLVKGVDIGAAINQSICAGYRMFWPTTSNSNIIIQPARKETPAERTKRIIDERRRKRSFEMDYAGLE